MIIKRVFAQPETVQETKEKVADVIIMPTIYSSMLDPSAPYERSSFKTGIYATAPLGKLEEYEKVTPPGTDKVDLEKYI